MASNSKISSLRQNKIGEKLRYLISNFLIKEDFYEHYLSGFEITITDVYVSNDLRKAKIYVVSFDKKRDDFVIKNLNKKNNL